MEYEPPSPESQGMKYGYACPSLSCSYLLAWVSGNLIRPRTAFLIDSFSGLLSESESCHSLSKKFPWPLGPNKKIDKFYLKMKIKLK